MFLSDDGEPAGAGNPTRFRHAVSSAVAAQIAWWLAFFPPEQILILSAAELHDPARARAVRRPRPCCASRLSRYGAREVFAR